MLRKSHIYMAALNTLFTSEKTIHPMHSVVNAESVRLYEVE